MSPLFFLVCKATATARLLHTRPHGVASKHAVTRRTSGNAASPLAVTAAGYDNEGMDIVLNGEPRSLPAPQTVLELLQGEGLAERRVAVEINGEIVPRSRHGEHRLGEGDRIEIVHALGGG